MALGFLDNVNQGIVYKQAILKKYRIMILTILFPAGRLKPNTASLENNGQVPKTEIQTFVWGVASPNK